MQAIVFDVFGTIVDWRSSLINQFNELEKELGFVRKVLSANFAYAIAA